MVCCIDGRLVGWIDGWLAQLDHTSYTYKWESDFFLDKKLENSKYIIVHT